VAPGLPNNSGSFSTRRNLISPTAGANGGFSHATNEGTLEAVGVSTTAVTGTSVFTYSAQKSNSIFGNSETVQPSSMRTLALIRAY